MVASASLNSRMSLISLAVAEDSGWYDVNFQQADPYTWGRGKGCEIFDAKCPPKAISEFCGFPGEPGCSDDFGYITKCEKDSAAGRCFINISSRRCRMLQPQKNESSICLSYKKSRRRGFFDSSQTESNRQSGCFKIRCDHDGRKYTVFTRWGNRDMQFVCDKKGQNLRSAAFGIDFFCQDPRQVCSPKTNCPHDCYSR